MKQPAHQRYKVKTRPHALDICGVFLLVNYLVELINVTISTCVAWLNSATGCFSAIEPISAIS